MKAYFNVHGHLVVEGEDATEWLALKSWTADWTGGASPLWVSVKAPGPEGFAETDCRQLFRTQPSPAPEPDEANPFIQKADGLHLRYDSLTIENATDGDGLLVNFWWRGRKNYVMHVPGIRCGKDGSVLHLTGVSGSVKGEMTEN